MCTIYLLYPFTGHCASVGVQGSKEQGYHHVVVIKLPLCCTLMGEAKLPQITLAKCF